MNCDLVVLNFLTRSRCRVVNNGTHHKPSHDGPAGDGVYVLDHIVELVPYSDTVTFLISGSMASTVAFIISEENFGGSKRAKTNYCCGIRSSLICAVNALWNWKFNIKFVYGGIMVGGVLTGTAGLSFLPITLNPKACLLWADIDTMERNWFISANEIIRLADVPGCSHFMFRAL